MPTNAPQNRVVNGLRFDRTAEGYIFFFSKRHSIILSKMPRGWQAREMRLVGKGRYMELEKRWEAVRIASGENMEEAVAAILDEL